jgi:protein-tyrosine phosphatase
MAESFPFELNDIKAWIIRRKDGTVVRYNLVPKGEVKSTSLNKPIIKYPSSSKGYSSGGFSAWCNHTPSTLNPPIFTNGRVSLWIADAPGARKSYEEFDVCIDGGAVLPVPGEYDLPNLFGDPGLSRALASHTIQGKSVKAAEGGPKILKIRWADRCPPPVYASFWPALLEYLYKLQSKLEKDPLTDKPRAIRVLTICQGGHGRSGSALVALTMCMTDYSPLDALTHIRALHCARAIESKDQHGYLNILAAHLGREQNALEAENVKSFKDRFLSLEGEIPNAYKDRVRAGKGALVSTREDGYL